MDVKPYTIAVPEKALEQLSERLRLTTFADQLDSAKAMGRWRSTPRCEGSRELLEN